MPVLTQKLSHDTGLSATDMVTSNDALTGTANPLAIVTLTANGRPLGMTIANLAGNWSFTPIGLADGIYTVVASVVGSSTSLKFTLDTTKPVVTEVLANDTGKAGDRITTDPTLTGTGEAGGTVTLKQGTATLGTTTVDGTGHWTFAPAGLTQGAHTIAATETDVAGNVGPAATLNFTLQSNVPVVTERLVTDTGISSTDRITSNPALTGTADANIVVTLTEGTVKLGTATANAAGNWSFIPTGLAQGAHTILATETTTAGAPGSASLTFTLDTIKPLVTEVLANDTGTAGDRITTDPTLTGTGEVGATITLKEGANTLGATTVDSTGHWTFAPTGLPQGAHTVVATETDAAGNAGSATLTFTRNNIPGRIISTSVAGPVVLATTDTPLTVTATGSVISTAATDDGIDGAAGTDWVIINNGLVQSAARPAIRLNGVGTITNGGSIIGGTDAVDLNAGGSLTNATGGVVAAQGAQGAGVAVSGGVAMVSNSGSITSNHVGILVSGGGTVTNEVSGSISITGDAGVFIAKLPGAFTNSGSITAKGVNSAGVYLENNGGITNNASGFITGDRYGVFLEGGAGTISNSGTIIGVNLDGAILGLGGSVINAAGAKIIGGNNGVYIKYRSAGTVTNAGSIIATSATGAGIDLGDGGTVTNSSSGSISGTAHGIFVVQAAGTINNAGAISGGTYNGVAMVAGGSVTNATGATIKGGTNGVLTGPGSQGSVANAGSIVASATTGAGVDFGGGGAVTNANGALISGAAFGVFVTGGAGTITNSGSISGSHGIAIQAGGVVTNEANGTIAGQTSGVFSQVATATVNNAGVIAATGAAGADIEAGGTINNAAGAALSGGSFGIFMSGGTGTVSNLGSISSVNNVGIQLSGGGSVTNGSGGSISGPGVGIGAYGGSSTVTNSGTITGGVNAVRFGNSGTNRLVVNPTAVFNGSVVGGTGPATNTLELAGGNGSIAGLSGGSGTVTQNDSWSFANFGTLAVDAGASWTVNGGNVANVRNDGTISVNGSLDVSSSIDAASSGKFLLNGGSTFEVAAVLGTNAQISFLGSSALTVDDTASFGSQVGTSAYTGPQVQAFGVGDLIDLKQFSAAGSSLTFDSTSGLLQLTNASLQTATLAFQTSSLGNGTFHIASDGASGSAVTFA